MLKRRTCSAAVQAIIRILTMLIRNTMMMTWAPQGGRAIGHGMSGRRIPCQPVGSLKMSHLQTISQPARGLEANECIGTSNSSSQWWGHRLLLGASRVIGSHAITVALLFDATDLIWQASILPITLLQNRFVKMVQAVALLLRISGGLDIL